MCDTQEILHLQDEFPLLNYLSIGALDGASKVGASFSTHANSPLAYAKSFLKFGTFF